MSCDLRERNQKIEITVTGKQIVEVRCQETIDTAQMSSPVNAIKTRKPREPMTAEAKAAMAAKRAATIAAKGPVVEVKARKPRDPMTEEAKAAMAAKRAATIAAKKAAGELVVKARKPRDPMTEEAKAIMAAKRAATIAAKGAVEAKARKPREPMTDEAKAAMAAKRAATIAAKKGLVAAAAAAEEEAEPEVAEPAPKKRKGKAKKEAEAEVAAAAEAEAAPDATDANVVQDAPAGPEAEPLVEDDEERADAYRYILMIQSTGLGATAIPGHLAADRNLDPKVAENYVIDFIHNFKAIKERYGSTGGYGKGFVNKEVKRREKAAAPKVVVPEKPQPKPRRWA